MRSLFVQLYFWVLGAITISVVIGVTLALTTEHKDDEKHQEGENLARVGHQMLEAYQRTGREGVLEVVQRAEAEDGMRYFLFGNGIEPIGMSLPPDLGQGVADAAQKTGNRQVAFSPGGPRHEFVTSVLLEDGFQVVAVGTPPSMLVRMLSPHTLPGRLLATALVAASICFFLARKLAAPILKLQEASRELARGRLDTRVTPGIGRPPTEIALLARDFDNMAEQIQTLMSARDRLLRDISHELRSPLARLNVALELSRQRAGGDAQKSLDRIEQESERLNELIGQLLTLTRSESGTGQLPPVEVDLQALVQRVATDADFEARGRSRGVRLVSAEPATLFGDPEMLARAVENVVRNGVWYTVEGSQVLLSLEVVASQKGREARISVRDSGPGVPEEMLENIFKPFFRVADARDRQSGGTGIGLAITERAVRLCGGWVVARNHPEGGLEVELAIPLDQQRSGKFKTRARTSAYKNTKKVD